MSTGRAGSTSGASRPTPRGCSFGWACRPDAVTWLFVAAGVGAAALLALDGLAAGRRRVPSDPAPDPARLLRWRGRALAGTVRRRAGSTSTASATTSPRPGCRSRLASAPTRSSSGLVLAVLVLLIKSETALVHVARAESGKAPRRSTGRTSPHRVAGCCARCGAHCGSCRSTARSSRWSSPLLALVAELTGLTDELLVALVPVAARHGARPPGRRSSPPTGCDDRSAASS